jgi:hypothetical protein
VRALEQRLQSSTAPLRPAPGAGRELKAVTSDQRRNFSHEGNAAGAAARFVVDDFLVWKDAIEALHRVVLEGLTAIAASELATIYLARRIPGAGCRGSILNLDYNLA